MGKSVKSKRNRDGFRKEGRNSQTEGRIQRENNGKRWRDGEREREGERVERGGRER